MTQAGPALPVMPVATSFIDGGPALRVAIVADGRPTEAGPARPIVIVSDGRVTQGNEPLPVVRATGAQAGQVLAGPAIPVVVVSGGSLDPNMLYTNKVNALGPIAYWPQAEPSGAVALDESGNGRNGAYTAVALGAAGIGDGRTAATYDGTNSFCNIYSASFAAAFNGQEGSQVAWAKVSAAGIWTDGLIRRVILCLVNASNRVGILKPAAVNEVDSLYVAGGTSLGAGKTGFSPAGYFHTALTWSKSADQMIFYVGGVAITPISTGLGAFTGALNATQTIIGALSTPAAQVWSGQIAHVAVFNRALSAAEVASLATL